ncbi:hypothetical protein AMATHDRAFT_75186 [Amanita thiersii Skay4041]|uniref:Lytic polysaccharide monooxygenase n=1 Tax=Amanita thiersii Skay4041 TaxID=703135 RepID=A0A2A9NLY8_9AGAR|nr:hypothetical protein AMATHDRAFT_75186 [Amanita thiersii Skay4041]
MLSRLVLLPFVALSFLSPTSAHVSIWHPSMFGFNVTAHTFSWDNRPVVPLANLPFTKWWFHGHLDYPPHPGDLFELPAGGKATLEVACDKGFTSYWASNEGGDIRSSNQRNYPCPGSPTSQFHTVDEQDVTGCALAITYTPDARSVKPNDFVVFSVNHKCVWSRMTEFEIPGDMPLCPEGGCTCAWFWIHSPRSGEEQMYMNGFKCTVTNSRPGAPALARPQLARRCGFDKYNNVQADPKNCTQGAKLPFYWKQAEGNSMFEGYYSPPLYNELYNFKHGAQNDIFVTSQPQKPCSVKAQSFKER